jgi:hypothetical protein
MRSAALLVFVALVSEHPAPTASQDTDAMAEALFHLGQKDEDHGEFARAVAHDQACVAAGPGTRWAARASERIEWLQARSEGGFVPLARLERVRRDPALARDPVAIEALARDADTFPPGNVRVETRMLVAEAWLGRMGRPGDAIAELREVSNEARADPLTIRLAERELVDAMAANGDIAAAAAEALTHTNLLDPGFLRRVNMLLRRRWERRIAVTLLATFLALATAAIVRAQRRMMLAPAAHALRGLVPIALPFVVFVALGGGVLASQYESGNAQPFVLLGAAALPLLLVTRAWSAVGSQRPVARVSRAVLCGATVLAAAFTLLDVINPEYLEGFGL